MKSTPVLYCMVKWGSTGLSEATGRIASGGQPSFEFGGWGGLAKGDSVRVPRQDRTRQAQTLLPTGYIRPTMRKDVFAVDQLDSWC